MKWKKQLIQGGILTAIFIFAIVIFSFFTNRDDNNMTADMGTATRPQVTFPYNGYALNPLPVYTKAMDILAMRDTITPVTNGQLMVSIKLYENKIAGIRYTVYTLDGEEKILESKVDRPEEKVILSFKGDEVLSEERVMELVLQVDGGKEFYLYTRLVDASDTNTMKCLDYVRAFHEKILDGSEDLMVTNSLESNEEGDNTTFHHVTIHSDYDHVAWGDLEPEVVGGERWNIKEMNDVYTSVELEYLVTCKGEENETDTYSITEFFRVRHQPDSSGGVTYLLDYDRWMEQIFDASHKILTETGILLGIRGSNVPYMVNKDGTIVSFIQANELWNYNQNMDEISLVFSFSDAENSDVRNRLGQHDVRLLEMDDDGNTVFAVIGYMNRGEHEGEVGVSVYYYNISQNTVEEKVFVSSNQSYNRTEEELGKLIYYSVDREMLYMLVEGSLYQIDGVSGYKKELVTGLTNGQYVVSVDGHLAAYQMQSETEEGCDVTVLNFETGEEKVVTCKKGTTIVPLGFIEGDFVYGTANTADIGKTVSGQEVTPMYRLDIIDGRGKTVKTYEQKAIYVLGAKFEGNMITLNRATKEGETYTGASEDYITNNEESGASNVYAESYVTELKETQMHLVYAEGIADKEPKLLKPKQVFHEKSEDITFDTGNKEQRCYVYGRGDLQGICDNAGEAIQIADEVGGVVVSEWQTYIWERGNRDLQYSIVGKEEEIETIRTQLRNNKTSVEIMEEISEGRSVDLTGCRAEQVLYIVNQDIPVIAMLNAKDAVIITGYNDGSVDYRDVGNGESHTVSYEEMDAMTTGSGHTYVAYVK